MAETRRTGGGDGRRADRAVHRAAAALAALAGLWLGLGGAAAPVGAQERPESIERPDAPRGEAPAPTPPPGDAPPVPGEPAVGLDQLLRLPDSYTAPEERAGGASADEWRTRFQEARRALATSERDLEATQKELESLASQTGNYQVSAPGVTNPENSGVNFGLRQKIREQREEVDARKRALRQLEVEADLAQVPEDWRR